MVFFIFLSLSFCACILKYSFQQKITFSSRHHTASVPSAIAFHVSSQKRLASSALLKSSGSENSP